MVAESGDFNVVTMTRSNTYYTIVPLSRAYLGDTSSSLSVYKLSPNCTAGKYLVQYLPEVRGFYHVSIQVPSVQEVQLIEIVSDGNLGGNFTLTVAAEDAEGTLVYSTTSILDMTSSESNIECPECPLKCKRGQCGYGRRTDE